MIVLVCCIFRHDITDLTSYCIICPIVSASACGNGKDQATSTGAAGGMVT
jgi:hypothetical protein